MPVNSGKLFVEWSRASASSHLSRNTRSLKSGMMLPSGQPLLQNGMPQSMQRAACSWLFSSREVLLHAAPVLDPLRHRPVVGLLAAVLQEAARISHSRSPRGDAIREGALVVLGEHLHESGRVVVSHLRSTSSALRLRVYWKCRRTSRCTVSRSASVERIEVDRLQVHASLEVAVLVEHVGDAAAHARREVAAGRARGSRRARRSCTRSRDRRRPRRPRQAPLLRTQKRSPATPWK